MNRNPKRRGLLKPLAVLFVVLFGTLAALPTFFPVDPVLQVSNEDGTPLDASVGYEIAALLDQAAAPVHAPELDAGVVRLRFANVDAQLRAGTELEAALPGRVIAFNLESRTPRWLTALGLKPVSLGLDLRGGVRFVYQVDLDALTRQLLEDGLPKSLLASRLQAAMEQNITTLRNRVNELGVSEAVVQSEGRDRISVEVPGVQDPAQLDRVLGSTATLEWRLQDTEHDPLAAARSHRVPPGSVLRYDKDGRPVLLSREIIVSGAELTDATFGYVQGRPAVTVRLDPAGARRMLETTEQNVGKPLAVVFVEEQRAPAEAGGATQSTVSESADESIDGAGAPGPFGGDEAAAPRTKRTETVIFDGRIENVLSNRFELRGLPPVEARDLALLLRAGSLAAPIYKVGGGTASPTLGQDNIAKGRLALIVGFISVVVFMAWTYRVFGLIADLALLANLVIVIGLLSLLQASLTLPGMAGLVLTVGMAADANVLIFERIREELARGRAPLASIEEGYSKAFGTIIDSNVTTLIAGAVLFVFGSGPVKGFAVTLSLGILTSMLTSIVGTRAVIDLLYRRRSPQTLPIGGRIG
ncbi:MAG TPA: protein translocase subunit SecD [Gammaproteobacteria bacterium]|nr:protein translocase subunit SecD [Gammaproteobacteria bacterium]